ncbi:MAG: hypothetical protein IPH63_15080 [Flavobacteriales bacterium]|nr:hypothetical protein [Flavobacteriales bacterium]
MAVDEAHGNTWRFEYAMKRTNAFRPWAGSVLRFLLVAHIFLGTAAHAQIAKHTYKIEAYYCRCDGNSDSLANSIQLGVRLDNSLGVYTALGSLVGCSDYFLNLDGERYKMTITKANGADGVAYLEPLNVGSSLSKLEKAMKREPKLQPLEVWNAPSSTPFILILQGEKKTMQVRGVTESKLTPTKEGSAIRLHFDMNDQKESDIEYERLEGGPLWIEQKDEFLAGIVTHVTPIEGGFRVTGTGLENVLDKSRYELYHTFVKAIASPDDACREKRAYWNGFSNFDYVEVPDPEYLPIKKDPQWEPALNTALLRIREHLKGDIPSIGRTGGKPSLCVYENDLEYAYVAWVQQASPEEHEDWKVLATFVKCYSNLYCKAQKPGDHHFDRDIIQLNELFETLSDKEITKMIDIRLSRYDLEDFLRENYARSQLISFSQRCERDMNDRSWMSDPCKQMMLAEEMKEWVRVGGRFPSVGEQPAFAEVLKMQKVLVDARKALIQQRLAELSREDLDLNAVMHTIEEDQCLSEEETALLMDKLAAVKATVEEKMQIEHGMEVIQEVREQVIHDLGAEAMDNVIMKLFRVEQGVGVEMTVIGGGMVVDRKTTGRVKYASDTTSIYRKGYSLGSLGDTLATAVARIFWDRICGDYDNARAAYSPADVEITGMADAVPIRKPITYPKYCQAEIAQAGVSGANDQLAFARAWTLREQLYQSDRCGLFNSLKPALDHHVSTQRGGRYRGIQLRVVLEHL